MTNAILKNKQIATQAPVRHFTKLWGEKAQREQKSILNANAQFDPYLIAAILKRDINSIKFSLKVAKQVSLRATLSKKQHSAFLAYYGKEIYTNPIKLAMKVCDSKTLEATKINEATRFDVLHCLAENWDALLKSAHQKGQPIPELADVLSYARSLKNRIPLLTFILGLSDKLKEEADAILKANFIALIAPTA